MTEDQSVGFLNDWNASRDHREKIYISYDSTNKNCQAGDIEIVEFGHPKADAGLPVFNYALAFDTENKEPLFYEKYPGSINDVTQLQIMLDKAAGYGYKKIGFILDRGYFSRSNIAAMDKHGHSILKEGSERTLLVKKLRQMKSYLMGHTNEVIEFGPGFSRYFILHYNGRIFQFPEDRTDVIDRENELSGYFCIITSEKMTAKEAIKLYKSRDASEKLFRGDKSYLGDKSLRIYGDSSADAKIFIEFIGDSSADAKIFIEFIALIIRNRIYNYLQDEMKALAKRPNFMTVPAAIRELEKIEMVRLTDNRYRLDHAVTATQKTILKAFGMDAGTVKNYAAEISRILREDK